MGGISIWQLLILLAIIVLLFGTKRLRSLGSDVGSAVKGFKKSMQDSDETKDHTSSDEQLTKQDKEDKSTHSEEKSTSEKDTSRK